ncbi:MAG: tetratricopeptide repeat protein [Bacteroidetes bacterium]|nr:tetratricopeptide repeat protein [Bacteroidota bacterium]MBK9523467.1 tetratricopeptide repeat protein [Bacteroidota bacterium]MBK9541212.1 tetratricopeptide repeat protein [Bacteroidota bacterium]MBP6648410.1 tetratricopeptide repeat protein [Bacteroidia bacterium]
MRIGNKQLLFVAGAIVLSAILYLAPKQLSKVEGKTEVAPMGFTFEGLLSQAKNQLKRQESEPIRLVENSLLKDTTNTLLLDSLGRLWDQAQFPVISSHYFEAIAKLKPDEKNWINAAYRYFDAFKSTGDSTLRKVMVESAIASYKKVLEINPKNLDAQTDLGVCYAEGTGNPMQGILMLREVVKENPEHESAQFNLGILSVKSGQMEKAVERFEKVLLINPKRLEARYILGQTYMKLGNNEKALLNLEQVKKESSDPQLNQEVNSLISQINNH